MTTKSLMVLIGVDFSGFEAGMNKVKASMTAHQKTFTAIGGTMTAIGGVMTAFFGKAISEAVKSEAAQARLHQALSNVAGAAKGGADMLIEYAGALQQTTGIEDEAIESAMSLLATFGLNEKQIAALIPRVLDMATAHAKATGEQIDLSGATMALGRAVTGHMDLLGRQGVVLSEQTKKTGDLNLMIKDLDKSFGGAAAAAGQTFAGQMRILKVNIGETMEQIGGRLLPVLLPLVTKLGDVVKRVMDWIDAHQGLVKTLVPILAGVGGLLTVLGPLVIILPKIVGGVMGLAKAFIFLATNPIGVLVVALGATVAWFLKAKAAIDANDEVVSKLIKQNIEMSNVLYELVKAGKMTVDKYYELYDRFNQNSDAMANWIRQGYAGGECAKLLAIKTKEYYDELEKQEKALKSGAITLEEYLKNLGKLPSAYKEISTTIAETPLIGNWGKARQFWIDMFADMQRVSAVTFSFIGETSKNTVLKLVDDIQYGKELILELSANIQELTAGITETGLLIFGDFVSRSLGAFMVWGEGHKSILSAMGESFSGFVKSAIAGIGQMTASILSAAAKEIFAEKAAAIAHAIASVMKSIPFPLNLILVGGAIAAVTALFSGLHAFAEGGIVMKPTLALIGEKGPEVVLPVGRFGMAAAAAGAGPGNVLVRQTNFFYGDIRTAYDIDEISEKLAKKTQEAIQRGRR